MIEEGLTNGSGIVDLGNGFYAATNHFERVKLPLELVDSGRRWCDVKRSFRIMIQWHRTKNESQYQLKIISNPTLFQAVVETAENDNIIEYGVLHELDHPKYDLIARLNGMGGLWIKKGDIIDK